MHEKKSQIAQKEKRNKSEVAFSRLNELRISGMGRWRKIWQDKLNVDSFYELNFLMVKIVKDFWMFFLLI